MPDSSYGLFENEHSTTKYVLINRTLPPIPLAINVFTLILNTIDLVSQFNANSTEPPITIKDSHFILGHAILGSFSLIQLLNTFVRSPISLYGPSLHDAIFPIIKKRVNNTYRRSWSEEEHKNIFMAISEDETQNYEKRKVKSLGKQLTILYSGLLASNLLPLAIHSLSAITATQFKSNHKDLSMSITLICAIVSLVFFTQLLSFKCKPYYDNISNDLYYSTMTQP